MAGAALRLAPIAGLLGPRDAAAHAFGQRYDLPVPLWLYLLGAGATVAVSFAVIAGVARAGRRSGSYPRLDLLATPLGPILALPVWALALRLGGIAGLALVVLTGLLGEPYPVRNLAPTLVWILWWVGLAYLSALAGNLWVLLNPWSTAFAALEAVYRRLRPGRELALRLPYPEALGAWPGAALLLAFAWAELVYPGSAIPASIAWMAIGYSLVTWAGMWLFGRERWLASGEAFAIAFGVLARLAPTEAGTRSGQICAACEHPCRDATGTCSGCAACYARAPAAERRLALRPYAAALLGAAPASPSMVAFVLLMLSTILYDGLLATPLWARIEPALAALLPGPEGLAGLASRTLGLVLGWALFGVVYALVCALVAAASGAGLTTWRAASAFIYTLVPIAFAYHLAHYLTYLLVQGQRIVALASDPFGFGWDLLGTAGYRVDIGVVGARFAWYTAVVAIVAGHVVAIYLAHRRAGELLPERRLALRSQYPMSALMVLYTVGGLWVLAQPIVETAAPPAPPVAARGPGLVEVPPDALVPVPGTGALTPAGSGRRARRLLTYRVMTSAFHDGTRMGVADILYAYAFAYRWGARAGPADRHYDPAVAAATRLMRERLVAVRLRGVDRPSIRMGGLTLTREQPVIEIYLDAAPRALDQAAAIAPPWSSLPWHLLVLMEEAVGRGWAAFSAAEARARGVAWLDLARDQDLGRRLAGLAGKLERQAYRPPEIRRYASAEEARHRWQALARFHEQHGHFLVTNGPYLLKDWSPQGVRLEVFRDISYPLGVGSYDAYPIARRAYISAVARDPAGLRLAAEVEQVERMQRRFRLVRRPLGEALASGPRRDTVECRYLILDGAGAVAAAGSLAPGAGSAFAIPLSGLAAGAYTVIAALYVNGNAMNVEVREIPVEVGR